MPGRRPDEPPGPLPVPAVALVASVRVVAPVPPVAGVAVMALVAAGVAVMPLIAAATARAGAATVTPRFLAHRAALHLVSASRSP